ncbi:MAG: (R)-mandelonitrile lyase [Sporichthyaceae bacterium]
MDPYAQQGNTTNRGPDTWFTGEVFFDTLIAGDATPGSIAMLKVRFTPGARTFWHAHPAGQALHVVDGTGRTAERDGPLQIVRAGDSIHARPMVWHWHGAGPETFMTHIAVQIGDAHGEYTVWGDPVTDSDYRGS